MFSDTVAGHDFLRAQFYLDTPTTLRLTVAVPRGAVAGFYARRDAPPSYTRHDVFHVVDATKVVPGAASSRQRRRAADTDHTTVRTVHPVYRLLLNIASLRLCKAVSYIRLGGDR